MGYAVELYFDEESEAALLRLRAELAAVGVPDILSQLDARPHLSLAVFSSADSEPLVEATAAFAESTAPFDLTLSHIGAFPTAEGIVYLGPTPSVHLLELHRAFHKSLSTVGIASNDYYLPGQWVPHCTASTDLTPGQMARAVRVCVEIFQPIEVTCAEIGIVSFRPVQGIATFPLQGESESPLESSLCEE